MYTIDVDTLAMLQRERYNDFVREAALLRLLRVPKETSNPAHPAATTGRVRTSVLAAFQHMVWTALQTHGRAVPPR